MKARSPTLAIATKELADGLRSRWIWTVAVLLAVSVLAIAFFGAAPVGVTGTQEGEAMIASLVNLSVYLVPLLALVLGCGAIIEEKRRGTLDLILVSPLSAREYFAGTFLGFALALAIAVVAGFGVAGLAVRLYLELDVVAYVAVVAAAYLLGVVFLALSFLLSILARDVGRAVILSVFVWLVAVLLFDLLLIALLIGTGGAVPEALFEVLLLLNPADVFRLLCLRWLGSAASALGFSQIAPLAPPAAVLAGALFAWLGALLGASYALFRHRVANDTLV